jgi:hypothetical protein
VLLKSSEILILSFSLFLLFFFIFFKWLKKRFIFWRGMNLDLLEVTIPPVLEKEREKEIQLLEYLQNVKNFFSSLAGIREKNKFLDLLIGDPIFVFEIAVHRIGEEIHFYVACPKYLTEVIEKQILSYWPRGLVRKSLDYNIFNPVGFSFGAKVFLNRNPVFPLQSSEVFKQDPISSIVSALTKLEKEGEGAAIQILIRKTKNERIRKIGKRMSEYLQSGKGMEEALTKAKGGILYEFSQLISLLISPQKPTKTEYDQTQQILPTSKITPVQQEIITAIAKKANLPIFDVNLRILSSAKDKERAGVILSELESAFSQFNSSLNSFRFFRVSEKKSKEFFYQYSFRLFDEGAIVNLSSEELANIFHFPLPTLFAPSVKWLKAKEAPAPPNLPEEGIVIGKNIFRGEEKVITILPDDRRRHMYIVGQTGTGKSTLILEMIKQDIERGEGVGLIDPHGDLAERVLGLVPPERVEDVVYFNPGDTEWPIGLNMLEYDPRFPEAKTFVVNELLEIFEKLYNLKALGFGGPIFEQYMRNSLLLVMEHPESGNTLIEVPKVLADPEFRKLKLSHCQNIVVKNFWELEAEKAGGELALANLVPYITSKLNAFIANDLLRPIISQQKSTIDFREIMDSGKILVVNLSKGKLGDVNSYLLGMIIIGKILLATFSRIDTPEEERRDFYLYIDEFHNVTTRTVTNALAEARKFKLNLILAHQFIGQLDEETKKAILGNVGTILAFRVGPDDAKYLITQFSPIFDEQDLVNFDNYAGAMRLLIRGITSKPFSFSTLPPSKSDPKIAEMVKTLSRAKYGRNRHLVEAELLERLSGF